MPLFIPQNIHHHLNHLAWCIAGSLHSVFTIIAYLFQHIPVDGSFYLFFYINEFYTVQRKLQSPITFVQVTGKKAIQKLTTTTTKKYFIIKFREMICGYSFK